jgi:hypothetical protein
MNIHKTVLVYYYIDPDSKKNRRYYYIVDTCSMISKNSRKDRSCVR